MVTLQNLSHQAIAAALETLPGWTESGPSLTRTYTFGDFSEAFGFMCRAALVAEKLDHHPDWRNVWRTVDVRLTTHDTGGVTERDVRLAREMDRLAGQ